MKITYSFANDETTVIEVDEKWGEILIELNREEYNNDQKETRRHAHFESMEYEGEYFAVEDCFFEHFFDDPDEVDTLYEAMKTLKPKQKEILKALYFDGFTQKEYAKKIGISQAALSQQLQTIFKKIKKFF